MRIHGRFTTPATADALASLGSAPEVLDRVPTLDHMSLTDDGSLTGRFAPQTSLGPIPLQVRIRTISTSPDDVHLHVFGRRGWHLVETELHLALVAGSDATEVTWDAELTVRGGAASVGQRVAGDVAARAIGDLLAAAGEAAAATEGAPA